MLKKMGIILMGVGSAIIIIGLFLLLKQDPSVTVLSDKIELIKEEVESTTNGKVEKDSQHLIFYDNYGLKVNYGLINKNYTVQEKDSRIIIDSKDKKYHFEITKLYDQNQTITNDTIAQFENLKLSLRDKYQEVTGDIEDSLQLDPEIIDFKEKYGVEKDIRFMSLNQKRAMIEDLFEIDLSSDISSPNTTQEQAETKIITETLFNDLEMNGKLVTISLVTLSDGTEKFPYPATFAIYESTTQDGKCRSCVTFANQEEMQKRQTSN